MSSSHHDTRLRRQALQAFPPQGISKESFPAEFKDYHPQTFSHRHKLCVLLRASGLTNNEISEVMGYDPARVSIILNDPRADVVLEHHAHEVADSLEDVRLRLKFYASEALDEVVDEMRHDEDSKVRQRAAFGILDRAGYSKIEKRFVATTQIDADAAREISSALLESDSAAQDEDLDLEYEIVSEGAEE